MLLCMLILKKRKKNLHKSQKYTLKKIKKKNRNLYKHFSFKNQLLLSIHIEIFKVKNLIKHYLNFEISLNKKNKYIFYIIYIYT